MGMIDAQIIVYNREACERVLVRANRKPGAELATLDRSMLCGTEFEVLEALAWAYRRIEALEGAARADDERLRKAALWAGIGYVGCDTPAALANRVAELERPEEGS